MAQVEWLSDEERLIESLREAFPDETPEKICRQLQDSHIRFGWVRSPWKNELRPCAQYLFGRGNLKLLEERSIGIVGTRNASRQGKEDSFYFAKGLATTGIVVVSGLALGVDSFAHRGALAAGSSNTVAVLGSGLNHIYPKENGMLASQILERDGLLISEYLPDARPQRFHFPLRNRLIAAFSEAILLIEAPNKSGALITAKWALELGKDILAVPGPRRETSYSGNHQWIRNGATLVVQVEEVLEVVLESVARDVPPHLLEWLRNYDRCETKWRLSSELESLTDTLSYPVGPQSWIVQNQNEGAASQKKVPCQIDFVS